MSTRNFSYNINDLSKLEDLGDGISSSIRLKILYLLTQRSYSIQDLLRELNISASTLSFHLKILSHAKLIKYVKSPSKRGNEKNVSLGVESIKISFNSKTNEETKHYFENIPIGSFSNYDIKPPCLIATQNKIINPVDNVAVFSSFQKIEAQLISFTTGFIEYCIVLDDSIKAKITEISFSQELCSECPNYNNSWKSNITFWINNVEIGSFLSFGDYGGRKGNFSPSWLPINSSNYGVLVEVKVNKEGTFINGKKISDINIDKLNIKENPLINYKIGVKPDSKYAGGVNIFGKNFGDYKQDIIVGYTVK